MCPTQKTTFVPGCMPFYRKIHVFCRIRRLFYHFWGATGPIDHFNKQELEPLLKRQYFRNLLALAHDVIIRVNAWPVWGEPLRE